MHSTLYNSTLKKGRVRVFDKKVTKYTATLLKLLKKNDYSTHESSLVVPSDDAYQKEIIKSLARFKGIKHVVLVGIGGSSLGTEAVYRALAFKTSPSLIVLDTINAESIQQFENCVKECTKAKDIVLVIVSKSGTTTETMMNATKVLEIAEKKFGEAFTSQTIFIGDKNSPFYKIGKKKKILCFYLPEIIGGRYSVFTAVGIVPLTLLGIDTISLREGASSILAKKELSQVAERALTLAIHAEEGMHTVNFFTFNERLTLIGFWYRQLLAESIGKNMTTKGTTFSHQLLPIVSTKADLHSMTELYLGGYKNMYTHFVSYDESHPFHLLSKHWLLEQLPFLKTKTSTEVNEAIKSGVIQAYEDQKLPYRITELEKCTAYEIGKLLASLMAEMMYLAHILDIDPFHQPSVELYKKHTRTILNS